MNISEAGRRTGVAVDTIRYYDRLGLLGALTRTAGQARVFTEDDLGWLRILRCLRDTGMRMADLRRFVAIDGDREPARRRELLEAHRAAVLERIERTHRELEVLDGKIVAYREMEERAAQPAIEVGRMRDQAVSRLPSAKNAATAAASGSSSA